MVSVDVISLYFMCCSVDGPVCLVCCGSNSICELFGETICYIFGCCCYLLLNVLEVFSVGGGALFNIPGMVF